MREILTLQFGDFANLAGSEFWNTQYWTYKAFEDQDVDELLPRETLFIDQDLTPRVICVGNALPPISGGIETSTDVPKIPTWSGEVDVHFTPSTTSSTSDWRSLSKVEYRERSLNLASSNGVYFPGQDQILENIRYFTEKCDWLQGFQLSFDKSPKWGSLFSSTLSSIHDLYSKKPNITFLLHPAPNPIQLHQQKVDDVVSLALAMECSELVVPFSHIKQEESMLTSLEGQDNASLLFALLMDSSTIPIRIKQNEEFDLSNLGSFFSKGRRSPSLLGVCGMMGSDLNLKEATQSSWKTSSEWLPIPITSGIEAEIIVNRGLSQKANQEALIGLLGFEGFRRLCRTFWCPYDVDLPSGRSSTLTRLIKSEEIDSNITSMLKALSKSKHNKTIQHKFENWGSLIFGDLNQTIETILESVTKS